MKCQAVATLVLLALAAAVTKDEDATPVGRVVTMLKDLQVQTVADGKAEEQSYNKYACFCETSTTRKANDITKAEGELRGLGQQILKLKGSVATLAASIQEKASSLAENSQQQEDATALRQRRNGKFMKMQQETKEALSSMEMAIQILSKGSEQKKDTRGSVGLMQVDLAVQATSAVQSAMDKLPLTAPLNEQHMSLLSEFVTNGADGTYSPQSATIQGIMGDMYATMAADLEDATMAEANQNKNYEGLTATLEKEATDLDKIKSRMEADKASAESDLADTTATYDDTQDQMKADIQFFDETKNACEKKSDEWTLRQKLRAEELKGINKALEFLTSDKARELFAKAITPGRATSLLQIEDAQAVSFKAYQLFKAHATKTQSLRLAALAVRVRMTGVGHFGPVLEAIDKMMGTLNSEGDADQAKRDQCGGENQKIAKKVGDLDWQLKKNNAKIDKLEALIDMRTEERADTIKQIAETKDYINKISANRKNEHEQCEQSKKDDNAAIGLLNQALKVFSAYGKNNDANLLQQAEADFAVSKDQAPDASFSGKDSNAGASKGVVSMMNMIIADLEDEVAASRRNEIRAQTDFEEELQTAKTLVKDLSTKSSNLESIIAKRKQEKGEEGVDKVANNKDRFAALEYESKIKPDCDWIKTNFAGRATARKAEMDGLVSGKEFLAGKGALLQLSFKAPVKAHTDDSDKLAKIGFLGVQ